VMLSELGAAHDGFGVARLGGGWESLTWLRYLSRTFSHRDPALTYAGLACLAVTLALLIYWSLDRTARWRYRAAAEVTLAGYFGVTALATYRDHKPDWQVACFAVAALLSMIIGIWELRRRK
jgi:hypothetical protein